MKPKKYRLPPPARSDAPPAPAEIIDVRTRQTVPPGSASVLPGPIYPHLSAASSVADGVNIIEAQRLPRLWLRVALAVAPGTDPARAALAAADFASRVIAADRRLRLAVDAARSAATGDELVLTFVLGRWGVLESQWVEEVKPAVRELAAGFEGAELKSIEVVKQGR